MEAEISHYLNDLDDKMKFIAKASKTYPRWGTTQYDFPLRFRPEMLEHIHSFSEIMDVTTELFIRGIERALNASNLSQNDRIRIVLRNPRLDRYTSISFRTLNQLDIEADIVDKFEQLLQSGETLFFADELEINVVVARPSSKKGSSFLRRTMMSLNRWLERKRSIVTITNEKDKMCFARA